MPLPYTTKGMDVSFSGILTAIEQYTTDKRYRDDGKEYGPGNFHDGKMLLDRC